MKPPQRMSVDDPDYDPVLGSQLEVLLDGERLPGCFLYDCDAGVVVVEVLDARGRPRFADDEYLREARRGEVTVRLKE